MSIACCTGSYNYLKKVGTPCALTIFTIKTQILLQRSRGLCFGAAWTLLVAFAPGFTSPTQASENTNPMEIVKTQNIPGKFHAGECQMFADGLFQRLDAAGIKAYKITFNWESYKFTARTRAGTHMFVVFQDSRGRYYGVDNMSRRPVWLQGNSPGEWTEFFVGMDMGTGVASSIASNAASRKNGTLVAAR